VVTDNGESSIHNIPKKKIIQAFATLISIWVLSSF